VPVHDGARAAADEMAEAADYVTDPALTIVAVAHMKRHPKYWIGRLAR
jgi:hypothetical protein